jgi:hypothetical protein
VVAEEDAMLRAGYGDGRVKHLAKKIGRPLRPSTTAPLPLGSTANGAAPGRADEDRAIAIAWRKGVSLPALALAVDRDTAVVSKRAIECWVTPSATRTGRSGRGAAAGRRGQLARGDPRAGA